MVLVDVPHLPAARTVRFLLLNVISCVGDTVTVERSGDFVDIDVLTWCGRECAVSLLDSLSVWSHVGAGLRLAPKRRRLADAVADNEQRMLALPYTHDNLPVSALVNIDIDNPPGDSIVAFIDDDNQLSWPQTHKLMHCRFCGRKAT